MAFAPHPDHTGRVNPFTRNRGRNSDWPSTSRGRCSQVYTQRCLLAQNQSNSGVSKPRDAWFQWQLRASNYERALRVLMSSPLLIVVFTKVSWKEDPSENEWRCGSKLKLDYPSFLFIFNPVKFGNQLYTLGWTGHNSLWNVLAKRYTSTRLAKRDKLENRTALRVIQIVLAYINNSSSETSGVNLKGNY